MKKILPAIVLALMSSTLAFADSGMGMNSGANSAMSKPEKKLTKQQMKMKTCSKEAKEKKLKGEERRKFMKSCLSGKNK